MTTLRNQLAAVKGRAVDASKEAPIEHPYRTAAYHLLTRGDFVAGDIRYRLNRTIGRGGWSGHRDGPLNHHVNGGASYSGPSLATVLEWTLFPLGPVRVWSEPIRAEQIQAAVRIAATVHAVAATLEGEAASAESEVLAA